MKIRNKALDGVSKEYGVTSLQELKDQDLMSICSEFGVVPTYEKVCPWCESPTSEAMFNRRETEENLTSALSYSMYISKEFLHKGERDAIIGEMKHDESGDQTLKRYESRGIGIYKLKPGETKRMRYNRGWVEKELKKMSFYKHLEIEIPKKTK